METLEPIAFQAIQPTHKVTLKCSKDKTEVVTLAAKIKSPGGRRAVWVFPYGEPTCPQCGGTVAKSKRMGNRADTTAQVHDEERGRPPHGRIRLEHISKRNLGFSHRPRFEAREGITKAHDDAQGLVYDLAFDSSDLASA